MKGDSLMEKIARIVSEEGNYAKIEIIRASACGEKCGSCSGGCSSTGIYVKALNEAGGKPGQMVKIELETSTVMKAAFLAYVLPLIMLVLGVLLGAYIHPRLDFNISSEALSLLFGVAFLIISYGILKVFDISYSSKGNIRYRVTKVL